MLAVIFIAALGGNVFSVHVGIASTTDQANAASSVDVASPVSMAAAAQQYQPPASQRDLLHLMHLMGACLGLLAASGLLLFLARRTRQHRGDPPLFQDAFVAGGSRVTRARSWKAPPPKPPASSPVIRS